MERFKSTAKKNFDSKQRWSYFLNASTSFYSAHPRLVLKVLRVTFTIMLGSIWTEFSQSFFVTTTGAILTSTSLPKKLLLIVNWRKRFVFADSKKKPSNLDSFRFDGGRPGSGGGVFLLLAPQTFRFGFFR